MFTFIKAGKSFSHLMLKQQVLLSNQEEVLVMEAPSADENMISSTLAD